MSLKSFANSLLKKVSRNSENLNVMRFLPPKLSDDTLEDIFKRKNLSSQQIKLALGIYKSHQEDVLLQKKLLEEHRLSKAGWSLDYKVVVTDGFYASAEKISKESHDYQISCSSSLSIILLSVAIELDFHLKGKSEAYSGSSLDNWFSYLKKDQKVDEEIINWALDASILLYFHEVSHVIFGHCGYNPQSEEEVRALELDADFNAGTMFGCLLIGFKSSGRKPDNRSDITKRLIRASILLGIVMKSVSVKSEEYHFPTSRMVIFNSGCAFSLDANGVTPTFANEEEGNQYWGNLIIDEKELIYSALRKSSLSYYAGTEVGLKKDFHLMNTETFSIRENLKNGPLKKHKLKIKT